MVAAVVPEAWKLLVLRTCASGIAQGTLCPIAIENLVAGRY